MLLNVIPKNVPECYFSPYTAQSPNQVKSLLKILQKQDWLYTLYPLDTCRICLVSSQVVEEDL